MIGGLRLPGGPLEPAALMRVVEHVAARPQLWTPHLDEHAHTRTYASLHRDADLDVWALFWLPETDTGWHDHDTSSGAVRVVSGALAEHALVVGAAPRHRTHGAGSSFSFGPTHIHRLTCEVPRAVSIHAYSPPLWRLGQYSVDPEGILRRQSVSYADELRPVRAPAAA